MQIADKYGAAMLANWPNNETMNDHVIIPAKDTNLKERGESRNW